MNIFVLSWILQQCAKYHCDKHVIKQILETTQLLSTCHHVTNEAQAKIWVEQGLIYRKTHYNHPCSIWLRECQENYIWLCHFGIALCKEYAYRYDKKTDDHKCYAKLIFLIHNVPPLPTNGGVITLPKLAMPDAYKTNDPVLSYRMYYLNDKERMLVWRKRGPPSWVPKPLRKTHYQSEIKRIDSKLCDLNGKVRKTQAHLDEIDKLTFEIQQLQTEYESLGL